jgi:hypothetical protein
MMDDAMLHNDRYINQPNKSSCGPTAMCNALTWAGVRVGWKDFRAISKAMKTDRHGTWHRNFDRVLRRQPFFKVRRVCRPKLWQIEEHARARGAVIISFRHTPTTKQYAGHYEMILYAFQDGSFVTINDRTNTKLARHLVTRTEFKKNEWRYAKYNKFSKAWLLEKIQPTLDHRSLGPSRRQGKAYRRPRG